MQLSDFDFELPPERIAQFPVEPRDHSRLMVIDRASGEISHRLFRDLPRFLRAKDHLVLNNSKVIPARLFGRDSIGRQFEIFLLEQTAEEGVWKCLVRPGKKIGTAHPIEFPGGLGGEVSRDERGGFWLRIDLSDEWLDQYGQTPLPPYVKRDASPGDKTRYQTVYARHRGSVAAPTAGLHFTVGLLDEIRGLGVETEEVTLHVGYGTFAPIETEDLSAHSLHEEDFEITPGLIDRATHTRRSGGRVIAVGTTSARTLESLDGENSSGRTSLFIIPGYRWKNLDGLVTNFHLPRSSLFMLVCAFLGREKTLHCYEQAIREGYRFYSYGDAMFII